MDFRHLKIIAVSLALLFVSTGCSFYFRAGHHHYYHHYYGYGFGVNPKVKHSADLGYGLATENTHSRRG